MHIDSLRHNIHVVSRLTMKGFSLVELIVVMALIGIVLSVATMNFSDWQRKSNIERYTQELKTGLTDLRVKAMTRKMQHLAILNSNNYVFKQLSSAADDGNGSAVPVLLNRSI